MPELMQRESVKPAPPVWLTGLSRERISGTLLYPVGSGSVQQGCVQIHPHTADRFGFAPGETILLNQYGTAWPFRVERTTGVERGHARINNTEMDVKGICPDIMLAAHRAPRPEALPHNWPAERNRHDWLIPKELS